MSYEEAFKLAAEGKTNIEIFSALGLSVGEVKRRIRSDHDLVFAIVNGRSQFISQFLDKLIGAQTIDEYNASTNVNLCKYMVEKFTNENTTLAQAYDIAILESLSSLSAPAVNMTREQVTSQLRALK